MKRSDQMVVAGAVVLGVVGLVTGVGNAFDGGVAHADYRAASHSHHTASRARDCHDGRHGRTLFERYDSNDDGKLTQDEIDADLASELGQFDSDGDGRLDLAEYQPLWLEMMREEMVDRFQALDRDGDAKVTLEEYMDRVSDLVERLDGNSDGELTLEDFRGRHRPHGEAGKSPGQEL